jgi:hypothetical protein
MTVSVTTDTEVEGNTLLIMHATWNETDSKYDRKVLALADKDEVTITVDDEEENWSPSGEKRNRGYITGEDVEFEIGVVEAEDLSALDELGIVDTEASDGVKFNNSTADRRIGFSDSNPAAIEFGLFKDDQLQNAKDANLDAIADSELLKRCEGVKIRAGESDLSSTPVMSSISARVEGDYYYDYDGGA